MGVPPASGNLRWWSCLQARGQVQTLLELMPDCSASCVLPKIQMKPPQHSSNIFVHPIFARGWHHNMMQCGGESSCG